MRTFRNAARIPVMLLAMIMSSCAQQAPHVDAAAPRDAASFQFEGKPIHPGCLLLLTTDLADQLPTCTAIDLEGVTRSNRFGSIPVVAENGWYQIHETSPGGYEEFEYRPLGVTRHNVHIIETFHSFGGSGDFRDLLFVRLSTDRTNNNGRPRLRTQLILCDECGLGDRDNRPITIQQDCVIVGRSPHAQRINIPIQ